MPAFSCVEKYLVENGKFELKIETQPVKKRLHIVRTLFDIFYYLSKGEIKGTLKLLRYKYQLRYK